MEGMDYSPEEMKIAEQLVGLSSVDEVHAKIRELGISLTSDKSPMDEEAGDSLMDEESMESPEEHHMDEPSMDGPPDLVILRKKAAGKALSKHGY